MALNSLSGLLSLDYAIYLAGSANCQARALLIWQNTSSQGVYNPLINPMTPGDERPKEAFEITAE